VRVCAREAEFSVGLLSSSRAHSVRSATAADVDYGGGDDDANGNAQAAYYTAVRGGSWRRGGPKGSSLIREQQLASNAFSVSSVVAAPPVCRVCSVSVRARVFCVRVTSSSAAVVRVRSECCTVSRCAYDAPTAPPLEPRVFTVPINARVRSSTGSA